jgi:hypothetical protein
MTDLTCEVMLVTPEMAQHWLDESNVHNRNASNSTVARYALDMAADKWRLTAEPIKFDVNGNLIDGQHRLMASVRAGVSFTTLVARNVETRAQDVMDTGRRRSIGDQLRLNDYPYSQVAGTAAKILLIWDQGWLYAGRDKWSLVTHSNVLEYLEVNPDLIASIGHTYGMFNTGVSPATRAATFHVLQKIDREAAVEFFDKFNTGAELAKNSPILALRNRVANLKASGTRVYTADHISLIFRAWNYWRKGKPATRLELRVTAPKPE